MARIDRPVALYLGGIFGLSAGIILALGWLFVFRVPAFTDALVRDPAAAVGTYPVAVVLLAGVFLGTLLLFGLVVGFGARYGPDDPGKQ